MLVVASRGDEHRRITGKPHTVGEALRIEREHLLPVPTEGFERRDQLPRGRWQELCEGAHQLVLDPAPTGHAPAGVKLLPAYGEIWQEQECVARHERSFSCYQ